MVAAQPRFTLFPYTTLFRSNTTRTQKLKWLFAAMVVVGLGMAGKAEAIAGSSAGTSTMPEPRHTANSDTIIFPNASGYKYENFALDSTPQPQAAIVGCNTVS